MRGGLAWPQGVLRNWGGHRLAAEKDDQGTCPSDKRIKSKTENRFKKNQFSSRSQEKINGMKKSPAKALPC